MVWKRLGLLLLITACTAVVSVLVFGSMRYGGPDGLLLRVRAEVDARVPHQPEWVPTPLPNAAEGSTADDLDALLAAPDDSLATSEAASTPTVTPSLAPSPTAGPAQYTATQTPTAREVSPTAQPTRWPTATDTPIPKPTLRPTSFPVPTRTAGPAPAHRAAAPAVALAGFTHYWQTWNNCGPASLAMDLSYWGVNLTQAEVGAVIRPNKEDKHANADELAAYARSKGFRTIVRSNGDAELLRLLVSNEVPVIIPTWHENEKKEGMGHYRLVMGYDDARREYILYDSLESRGVSAKDPYKGIRIAYDELDWLWAVYNRRYLVVFPEARAPQVLSIVGQEVDDAATWNRSLAKAKEEVKQRPQDAFAWFTLGTNFMALGSAEDAAAAYDRARLLLLPYRMLWYQFGPLQAYYEVRRYDELLALVDATLAKTTEIEELHYWRAMGLAATGDTEGARKELQRAVAQRPGYAQAVAALAKIGQ